MDLYSTELLGPLASCSLNELRGSVAPDRIPIISRSRHAVLTMCKSIELLWPLAIGSRPQAELLPFFRIEGRERERERLAGSEQERGTGTE